ncbi:3-ketosteroid 9alpha-monooxygenase subunit B [Krasilnikovia cinnamomea]|uniref:3-ketosteroid 9alpha-monooxygenase subunit B n=1 Tax=Krasilnikovia cinnamomea TaxID=349313 RepID=A0A4Q7ZRB4_9ACTN|nr:ferredoxin--NADP reductase [Krasilnikovia cinnamomea]RZU53688.1 3-ketosteroid 9alpha-monooxygenase subunit B [Krasilnikovia cinnamomea]
MAGTRITGAIAPYHRLRVADVIAETADAHSLVLPVPPALTAAFTYRPGQYLTVRTPDGTLARCYSLSSSPHTDTDLKITVKRVPGGRASNWICDHVRAGTTLEFTPPAGTFTPASLDDDLLLLAGGSGITPVIAIVKSVLARGSGRLALVYANRDARSVIFATELAALGERHGGRLSVTHWLDSERGAPTGDALAPLLCAYANREAFVCGPDPFVGVARQALQRTGVPADRVRVESFDSDTTVPAVARDATAEVTLDGQTHHLPWPAGSRLLDVIISAGLNPPFSCRQGNCGTCACRLVSGQVELVRNEVLEEEDFAEGYILACQAVARSDTVAVTYE